ncbi:hypothetical protein [Jannaschia pohangensis]|uniref:Uncharacterized protein n=1 Tax=Jannaschia pohangensis TaxID=390807 RepID=A0A1I3JPD4_9RHOB|nr:hypothetical protein [Jannaschia pohangensis]SFI62117.1 hypothetical protein SAMN04488095_1386 [Jannaschia pohangensis]
MSPLQRLLTTVLPARWSARLEARTRDWEVACGTCDRSRDLWEAGGVRLKSNAEPVPGPTGECSGCGRRRQMVIRRKA